MDTHDIEIIVIILSVPLFLWIVVQELRWYIKYLREYHDPLNNFNKWRITKGIIQSLRDHRRPFDNDRWGHYLYDPNVSMYDYNELRQKDPTLPSFDPRERTSFDGESYYRDGLTPYEKWLYFSTDFGSYRSRSEWFDRVDKLIYEQGGKTVTKDEHRLYRSFSTVFMSREQIDETNYDYWILRYEKDRTHSHRSLFYYIFYRLLFFISGIPS